MLTPTAISTAMLTPTATATHAATPGMTATPTPTPTPVFTGAVMGGTSPVSGATVSFYAVGTSDDGVGATQLATTTSSSDGSFGVGPFTCPAGNPQTYLLVTGGDAGAGTNSAIGMTPLTGPCGGLGASDFVTVNESTTAAAAWALAQFSDATGQTLGTSSTNATGLTNGVKSGVEQSHRQRGNQRIEFRHPCSLLCQQRSDPGELHGRFSSS
jgi:hypothetical protein